ncbi:hypothetical protein [Marivirga sp.]|uniref:hypothetical protein n=1 Tax=Marivirga sp. TaxID=2018662 RepID=UPI002D80F20A|nr:hypothetical protein [Marivirga sp.]HET8861083.1 hypothetical protein [Marivirga sp.]
MKKFILLFLLANLACSVNTSEKVEISKLRFNYPDDAYIFFRNMRQTSYDLEIMEEGGWRIYRHEDRQSASTDFYFNIALVVNWRANKVYPIIEMPNSIEIEKEGFEVYWEALESDDKGSIILEGEKRRNEMIFTAELYNKLIEEVQFYVMYKNRKLPLFQNSDQKEACRVTLYDFYRMTGLL